jgi:hypothetical protein
MDTMNDFSQDFLRKINLSIKPESPIYWIVQDVMKKKSMLDIALKFLELAENDSVEGLHFEAFIAFKEQEKIYNKLAELLLARPGKLSKDFTVQDLIDGVDGPDFYQHLEKIEKQKPLTHRFVLEISLK